MTDFVVEDEVAALRKVRELLRYLPDSNASIAPFRETSDPIDRQTVDIDILLRKPLILPRDSIRLSTSAF